jgi:hypothetical protein
MRACGLGWAVMVELRCGSFVKVTLFSKSRKTTKKEHAVAEMKQQKKPLTQRAGLPLKWRERLSLQCSPLRTRSLPMRSPLALIALFSLTCGGTDPGENTNPALTLRSGSRLHHKLINADDGTVAQATGLYDTQLQTDCSFQPSEDGMMRCLPFGAYIQAQVFLDAGCAQPFATSSKCMPPMKYVVDYSSLTCGMMNRVLTTTEMIAPPPTIYYKTTTACTQIPNSYTIYRMYTLSSPAPASMFVGGMEMN